MPTTDLHVLIEMTDEEDCRILAAWLLQAAEAETLWSDALKDPEFSDRILVLHAVVVPDLAIRALKIFGEQHTGRASQRSIFARAAILVSAALNLQSWCNSDFSSASMRAIGWPCQNRSRSRR
jgi:hypothetical protein